MKRTIQKLPPMSAGERDTLKILLKELRRAVRRREQLHVTFDPWINGEDGAYIFAAPNAHGHTYEVLGVGARRPRPAPRRRKATRKP